jgi:LAS superfamily LD-carboxypeptidase LdcB
MPIWLLLIAGVGLYFVLRPSTALAYSAGKPISITLVSIGGGHELRADAAKAFNAMRIAAAADGLFLKVNSSFRRMEEQTTLYAEFTSGQRTDLVAKPGYSNHQSGVAVDIEVQRSTSSREYKWLAANARRFGFQNTGANFSKPEYWHWEFFT